MKRLFFTVMLCFSLLTITSCSFKKSEPAKVIPLDEGTRTTSPKASFSEQKKSTTYKPTKKTTYRKKIGAKKVKKPPAKSSKSAFEEVNSPAQIIYNNLAEGRYGNIPELNPQGQIYFPYKPAPQPVTPTVWDQMASWNSSRQ